MPTSADILRAARLSQGRQTYLGNQGTVDVLRRRFGAGSIFSRGGKTYFRGTLGKQQPPTSAAGPQTPDDITRSFVEQMRDLFTPAVKSQVTPFDESGFYNEADTRALGDSEYDPYYARLRSEQQGQYDEQERQRRIQEGASDRSRLEEVNAAGGYNSSAYQRELADRASLRSGDAALRGQALQRAFEEQDVQKRLAKEQFTTNRRAEAYNRYLQSIGAYST